MKLTTTNVTVCDGKYTFVLDEGTDGLRDILRYGEPWMKEESGYLVKYNRGIGALAAELNDARIELAALKADPLREAATRVVEWIKEEPESKPPFSLIRKLAESVIGPQDWS